MSDPITQFWIGRPVMAQIGTESDNRISLNWGIATGGHQGMPHGRQSFVLSIAKGPMVAEMIVRLGNPPREHIAQGPCTADPAE